MTLSERLQAEMISATRSQDALRRDTLRMAVAAVQNAQKQARRSLSDEEVVTVLAREVKTRRESVEAYTRAGRPDLAAKEESEVELLTAFLPQQLSEEEITTLVTAAIEETGATSARDLGRVMGVLVPRTRGRADGRQVSAAVARELARRDLLAHEHEA